MTTRYTVRNPTTPYNRPTTIRQSTVLSAHRTQRAAFAAADRANRRAPKDLPARIFVADDLRGVILT